MGWLDTKIKKESIHDMIFEQFPNLMIMMLEEEEVLCKKCFVSDLKKYLPSQVMNFLEKLISRKEYGNMTNNELKMLRKYVIEFNDITTCYWCKKKVKKIESLSLVGFGSSTDNECRECNAITKDITNSKIKELEKQLQPYLSKKAMIGKMKFKSQQEVWQQEENDDRDSWNWEKHVYGSRVDITKMKINAQNRVEDLELQKNDVERITNEINSKINKEKIAEIHRHFSDETKIDSKDESEEDSLKILKTRLVKGEITKEEYEELKRIVEE